MNQHLSPPFVLPFSEDVRQSAREDTPLPDQQNCMILVLGLPGSGKSSYAREYFSASPFVCISFDTIRRTLGHTYCRSAEPAVNAFACMLARYAFLNGQPVLVDEAITEPGPALDLTCIAREFGAKVIVHHLATPIQLCRHRRVPHAISDSEFDRKVSEWSEFGRLILNRADEVINVREPHQTLPAR